MTELRAAAARVRRWPARWQASALAGLLAVLLSQTHPTIIGAEDEARAVLRHIITPIAGAVAGVALVFLLRRRKGPMVAFRAREFALDVALVLGVYGLYELARIHTEGGYGPARANALQVLRFERSLGLAFESNLQSAVLAHAWAVRGVNALYSVFLPATCATLTWLYFTDRAHFRILRNALGFSVLFAAITIALLPVAPPRLLPESGAIDTFVHVGGSQTFANQYAAIPSLHVGWMAACGLVLGQSLGGRWRWPVSVGPGLLMLVTVMATGNHFWFDGVVGAAFAAGPAAAMLLSRPRRDVDGGTTFIDRRVQKSAG